MFGLVLQLYCWSAPRNAYIPTWWGGDGSLDMFANASAKHQTSNGNITDQNIFCKSSLYLQNTVQWRKKLTKWLFGSLSFCTWGDSFREVQNWFFWRNFDKIGSSLAPQFYANFKIWFKLGSPQLTTHKTVYKICFRFCSPSLNWSKGLLYLVLVVLENEIWRNCLLQKL